MIATASDLAAIERRLREKAQAFGEARSVEIARRGAPDAWRSPRILWPLVGKE